jgi:hypothetical protein
MECRLKSGKESVMALEPFRFVHAADLRLDSPVVGLGNPDENVDRLAEDATLAAFQRVVDACVRHDAEFLLLTGPIWCESLTARAWRRLASDCELLADSGTRVVWGSVPPDIDGDVRQMLAELPNLTLLSESDPDPVAVVREGRLIASLSTCLARSAGSRSTPALTAAHVAATTFHISILPQPRSSVQCPTAVPARDGDAETGPATAWTSADHVGINYLALGGGRSHRVLQRYENGWLHHPGTPQGVNPDESGARGCALVEVDSDGASRVEFLPTAVVRWEHLRMEVEGGKSRSQLVSRMQQELLDLDCAPHERLLCVHWLLVGPAPVIDAPENRGLFAGLAADIDAGLPRCDDVIRRHVFEHRQGSGVDDDPTMQEFHNALHEAGAAHRDELGQEFDHHKAAPWLRHVSRSLPRQDDRAVVETALRLGCEWLQAPQPRGG